MLFYLPFVAGLAVLSALIVIRLKGIRSYFNVVVWIASGVIVAQLSCGLFFVIMPPADLPNAGAILIVTATSIVLATRHVYRSLRPQRNHIQNK